MSIAVASDRGSYYPAFDPLRFVLALSVAVTHADLLDWHHSANFAVQIFFALSGWLIGGILIRSRPKDIPRFYFNRAMRIWVPYFVALAILVLASVARDSIITRKWYEFVFYMATFTYNLTGVTQMTVDQGPMNGTGAFLWSICAEEQFYLIAPALLIVLRFGQSIMLWSILAIVFLVSPFSIMFSAIALGVLAALTQKRFGEWYQRTSAMLLIGFLGALLFGLVFYNILKYEIFAPFVGVIVVLLCARRGDVPSPALSFLGGISYPLYLNHWLGIRIVNMVSNTLHVTGPLIKIIGVVMAIAISALLYLLVDVQIRKHREKWFTMRIGITLGFTGALLVATGIIGALVFGAPWIPLNY